MSHAEYEFETRTAIAVAFVDILRTGGYRESRGARPAMAAPCWPAATVITSVIIRPATASPTKQVELYIHGVLVAELVLQAPSFPGGSTDDWGVTRVRYAMTFPLHNPQAEWVIYDLPATNGAAYRPFSE